MTFQYCFDGSIKKVNNLSVSSPRTWGCFPLSLRKRLIEKVFPTHVGVFPPVFFRVRLAKGLPHARGGVSMLCPPATPKLRSSPRTWGCFRPVRLSESSAVVFPTHVGVFPSPVPCATCAGCLPHARGGVSTSFTKKLLEAQSSPRTWGCFFLEMRGVERAVVFPTHVGVFPFRMA